MRKILGLWRWWIPLLLFSADAHAWGLYTHVYFAQLLLWTTPLADPRFRKAVAACPRLVLAGACLPDLSLMGRYHGAEQLGETHGWEHAQRQLGAAEDDAERALSLGFACHLLADVIAHNHFVPAHEKIWPHIPVLTHAVAEWAMDRHIERHLFSTPEELLDRHRHELSGYMANRFGCTPREAWHSLRTLSSAEALLRASRLHSICHYGARILDERMRQRFNHYLRETASLMMQINHLIAGEAPTWQADPQHGQAMRERIGLCAPHQVRGRLPLPQNLFA